MNESIKTKNLFAGQFGPNRANHFERILLTMFIVGDQQMRRRENNFSSTVSIFINSYFVDLSRIVSSLEFICYKHSLKTYSLILLFTMRLHLYARVYCFIPAFLLTNSVVVFQFYRLYIFG